MGNSHLPEDSGFYIFFRQRPTRDQMLLKDDVYLDYLISDDSAMLIKTNENLQPTYYLLQHQKGITLVEVKNIEEAQFENVTKNLKVKHSCFSSHDKK